MSETPDLAEFLRARLDEDALVARTVKAQANMPVLVEWLRGKLGDSTDVSFLNLFLEKHDPARVLREVEAKRAIVNSFETASTADTYGQPNEHQAGYTTALDIALRNLAAVYSDHPDYDPAWA